MRRITPWSGPRIFFCDVLSVWCDGNLYDCDTCIDGRDIEVVAEYASTCDGCCELTLHEAMYMDEQTQLGYCEKWMVK